MRRFDASRPPRTCHCEVCGAAGNYISISGWHCCAEHARAPKPDFPGFHWSTGEPLPPDASDPKQWRALDVALDEALYPIDHLDFDVEVEPDEDVDRP